MRILLFNFSNFICRNSIAYVLVPSLGISLFNEKAKAYRIKYDARSRPLIGDFFI